jgi:hypothetical protein
MRPLILACLAILALVSTPASGQERVTLGVGRLFTNDFFADGQDRWNTGSYVASWVRGVDGTVSLPDEFGALMEYRFSTRILAPANLVTPAAGDRPYAGIAALGAYSHFAHDGFEFTAGSELVAVGPMTGLDAFHVRAHRALGMTPPSPAVRAGQLGNAVYPVLAFEAARPVSLNLGNEDAGAVLRPFVQLRGGDETYARIGADVLFGPNFTSGVLARDEATGLPYQTMGEGQGKGLSFLLGADTARVFSSAWLPALAGYTLTPMRNRARAGLHWQGEHFGAFYGATWLGPEFAAQPAGQVVGSLQLRMRF